MDMENVVIVIVIAKSCQKQAKNSKAKIQRKKSGYFLGFFSLDFFFCIFPWIVIFGYFSPIFLDLFFSFSCQKFFPISPQNFLVSFEVFSHFSRDFWIFSKSSGFVSKFSNFSSNFPSFSEVFQFVSKFSNFSFKFSQILSSPFEVFLRFSLKFSRFSRNSPVFFKMFRFFPKFSEILRSPFQVFLRFSHFFQKFCNFFRNCPISLRVPQFSNFLSVPLTRETGPFKSS